MSLRAFSLLPIFTLLSVGHSLYPCSFIDVAANLTFPNSIVRPVKDWRTVSNVSVDMVLYSVVGLQHHRKDYKILPRRGNRLVGDIEELEDTSSQSLTTLLWFTLTWKSELLSWDPNRFCSIKSIFIPGDNLWKPDLYIYEQTEADNNSPVVPYLNISYDGTITNSKPLRIVSSCELDIYRFPFDVQTCEISFGSYVYPVQDLMMYPRSDSSTLLNNTLPYYVNKGDWKLLNITVKETVIDADNTNFSIVNYKITLGREPAVYVVTFIIPACLMILLDIASMFINMESGERLGFKITIVLGFSVLLLILSSVLPASTSAPLLGIFCLVCMAAMVFSIIGCVAISHMLMLSESQPNVPAWTKTWVLTYLAKILCFGSFTKYGIDIEKPQSKMETYSNDESVKVNMETKMNTLNTQRHNEDGLEVKLLKRLLFQIHKIHKDLLLSKNKKEIKTEWHATALVVDRFVIVLYVIIVIVLLAVVAFVWGTYIPAH